MARQGVAGKFFWYFFLLLIIGAIGGWGGLALYYSGPGSLLVREVLAGAYIVSLLGSLLLSRSLGWGVLTALVIFGGVLGWWLTLSPTNEKAWQPDVAKVATGQWQGNIITVHNVRDFTYRSENDYTPKWETRQYDLAKLTHLDIFISYWGSPYIAHTIMSWEFSDGRHLAISVETRKSKEQTYSAVQGFFKQYNLIYVAATERDLIGLRTNFRHEDVYYYQLQQVSRDDARALLTEYVRRMNALAKMPQFYNALTMNCTTTILLNIKALDPSRLPLDWRLLLNGYLDKYLYDNKFIRTDIPFAQLKRQSRIDRHMQKYHGHDFSGYLRQSN